MTSSRPLSVKAFVLVAMALGAVANPVSLRDRQPASCDAVLCREDTFCKIIDGVAKCVPAPGGQCGSALCDVGLECCNPSCGICVKPGDRCTQQVCNLKKREACGPNTCDEGEVCCNESCGHCAKPGQACTQEACAPAPLERKVCGPNTCDEGEECCNESCGICTKPGGKCTEQFCGKECGPTTCDVGEVCCNSSCGYCTPPDGFCTMEFCIQPETE